MYTFHKKSAKRQNHEKKLFFLCNTFHVSYLVDNWARKSIQEEHKDMSAPSQSEAAERVMPELLSEESKWHRYYMAD